MAVRRRPVKNEISLLAALRALCGEREIEPDILYDAIEESLKFAYKKTNGADREVIVDLNRETGSFKMFEARKVVEEVTDESKEISLTEAQRINPNYVVGDLVRGAEVSTSDFGRSAAQVAKQFVVQKIREAERGVIYDEFNDRAEDVVTGTVERIEEGSVIVSIDKTEAILVPSEQIRGERFNIGDRIKAYVAEVRKIGKGPQIFLSRTHPGFLKRVLEMEVPEVKEGIIVVKSIVREAGARAKIAVISKDENVEPVGTCIGPRGMRMQNILNEIGNAEKIDVVKWSEDPAQFIAAALSPSKVKKVAVNVNEKMSRVIVPDNQLSLAIGRAGQNARLAARLTGWKIDIQSQSQAEGQELPENYVEVEIVTQKPKQQKQKQKNKFKNKNQNQNKNQNNQQQNKADKMPKAEVKPAEKAETKPVAEEKVAATFPFDSFDDFDSGDSFSEEKQPEKPAKPAKPAPKPKAAPAVEEEDSGLGFFEDF